MLIKGSLLKDGWCCNFFLVSNLVKFDRGVMIYKLINDVCSDSLQGKLVTRSQISNYSTYNNLHLDIPRQNLKFSERMLHTRGTKSHYKSQDFLVQQEIKRIPAQLASFPKAQSLGRPAISTKIISSLVRNFH